MRLGIHLPLEFFTATQAVQTAQYVEAAGLDHVVVNDHLRLPRGSQINEAWTVLAAIASVTKRIRLGPGVTPLPLRHPYLLAKMAVTVDQLSKGRLMMGVGAGWYAGEFRWMEAAFLSHTKRLAQTEEAIRLIRNFWTESLTTFHGAYYQAENIELEPKPVQAPHPPFLLGGGSTKILNLAATYGQGWMPFAPSISGLTRRVKQLDTLLSTKSRMLKDFKIIPSILLQFGESKKKAQQRLPKWGNPPNEDRAIFGTPSDCLQRIVEYSEAGATHLSLRLVHPDESQKVIQVIAQEILPNF